ncbi:hypothetical protein RTG_02682 [Rhodotorula toruloides ATCC 204091]|uniref:Stress response RCI peptide n=1 Tax=Rhodotorula toruloides TaxID=5286 RepID=A0A0K3C7V5_RHOTO|nr:hypothetical protein RTG_02682 [Rhodotorula toruloides ATCC 204091]
MAYGTYLHRQVAAERDSQVNHVSSWMTVRDFASMNPLLQADLDFSRSQDRDLYQLCLVVLSVLLPPAAVFLQRGCGGDLLASCLLTFLGFLPGLVHALYITFKVRPAFSSPYPPSPDLTVSQYESAIVYNPEHYNHSTLEEASHAPLTTDDILRAASDEDRQEKERIRREKGGADASDVSSDEGVDKSRYSLARTPSYRSTATGPPAYDAHDPSDSEDDLARYHRYASMSEKSMGKRRARSNSRRRGEEWV